MTNDDMALVREYAQSNSEQAFTTLVSKHVNLVYSVALRQVRDPSLAEEITQAVFIILARKAKSLSPNSILSGWLCRTARYVSGRALRTERRRQFREQEAQMQSTLNEPDSDAWQHIAPLLDEALNCLGTKEHDAVVLRFFEGKELKEVGAAMATTEDAARMRVNRGVEELRRFFTKRGVILSAAAIAGAVSANSVQAAPAALIPVLTKSAIAAAAAPATALATTKVLAMTTLQKAIAGAVLILLLWAAASAIFEWPLFYVGQPLYPCVDGLGHIEGGKRRWALETGQTNGTPVDPVQFERWTRTKGGLSPEYRMPHCPSGGIYTYGNVGQLPTCSLATNAPPTPAKERVGLIGWRWKIAPSRPESHVLTAEWIQQHLASPEEMKQLAR
jgi:RNA polymerase sigma factor (sigma-70 family)